MKDLEICSIPFSTLITQKSIFTKRLNTLVSPCNVEKQVTCCHIIIDTNDNKYEETTIDFEERYHFLQVIEQSYEAMQLSSEQNVFQPQVQYQSSSMGN